MSLSLDAPISPAVQPLPPLPPVDSAFLKRKDLVSALNAQVVRKKGKYETIAIATAVVVGIATAVTVVTISLFASQKIEWVLKKVLLKNGRTIIRRSPAPGYENRFALSLFGIISGVSFVHIFSGLITFGIGSVISDYKVSQLKKMIENVNILGQEEQKIKENELLEILKEADQTTIETLISKMDQKQLCLLSIAVGIKRMEKAAEKAAQILVEPLPMKEFKVKVAHVFSIIKYHGIKKMKKIFANEKILFHLIASRPPVRQKADKIKVKQLVSKTESISMVKEETLEVSFAKLSATSTFFETLLETKRKYPDDNSEVILEVKDLEGFKQVIDYVQTSDPAKISTLAPMVAHDIFKYFDKFFDSSFQLQLSEKEKNNVGIHFPAKKLLLSN